LEIVIFFNKGKDLVGKHWILLYLFLFSSILTVIIMTTWGIDSGMLLKKCFVFRLVCLPIMILK